MGQVKSLVTENEELRMEVSRLRGRLALLDLTPQIFCSPNKTRRFQDADGDSMSLKDTIWGLNEHEIEALITLRVGESYKFPLDDLILTRTQ